jgi:phosphopantothenoylcysteine decarboxylase/phosphopantothenate--cysteine ligase
VKKNITTLKSWGVTFIEPSVGEVVCGDEGIGKLADIEEIYRIAVNAIA